MRKYTYIAVNKKGERITGDMEAKSTDEVASTLMESNLSPIKINEKIEFIETLNNLASSNRVPNKEKVIFLREFSTMISAGLAIDDALEVSTAQTPNKVFKKVLGDITKDVRSGSSLASALEKFPTVFKSIEVSLIKAGEVSGKLDDILIRLADDVEKQEILKGKVKGAMLYPIFILIVAAVVVILITIKLVPAMQSLYIGFGASSLPLPTMILVGFSNFLTSYYILIIIAVALIYIVFKYYSSTPEGHLVIDTQILHVPILGDILEKYEVVTFIKTYAMLIASGIPLMNALNLTSESLGNKLFAEALKASTKEVEKGISLAVALSKYPFIPTILWRSIAIGEETGKTEVILNKIGDYYETQVNDKVNNLTRLIEPVLLLVLGTIVGFIAVAIYLPIYNFSNVIH